MASVMFFFQDGDNLFFISYLSAELGFEPGLTGPEPAVLPLDNPA